MSVKTREDQPTFYTYYDTDPFIQQRRWARGLNENGNGLLRQYFPKDKRLDNVSEEAMNHRPRKCLGFKTPWEVFAELTQSNIQLGMSGALMR